MRRYLSNVSLIVLPVLALLAAPLLSQDLRLPLAKDSLHMAIIGDSGTGSRAQYEVAEQIVRYRELFPFQFVLMLGDNLYGREKPKEYEEKFARPYKALLDAGVKFYAALGNHDDRNQRFYRNFNMDGERYYSFRPKPGIRFFALDSNYMDREQLEWLEKELKASASEWKICFFHHPLYASGMHGSSIELREALEPLFVKYGVSVVFAGHEHFYERSKPQKGIHYFVSGGAGKLRRGDIRRNDFTAKGFDQDYHFMLIEIAGDQLHFQAIARSGQTIDSGVITQRPMPKAAAAAGRANGQSQ